MQTEPAAAGVPRRSRSQNVLFRMNRTAHGDSVFVTDQLRRRVIEVLPRPRPQTAEIVAMRLIGGAMELVRSAFRHDGDRGGTRILRIGSGCLDAKLLNGVETGLHGNDAATEPADHRDAVEEHLGRTDLKSVDARIRSAFYTRSKVEQVRNGAPIQRELSGFEGNP